MSCKTCHDTGVVDVEVDCEEDDCSTDPGDKHHIEVNCPCCEERS